MADPLVDPADVSGWLQRPVAEDVAKRAIRVAEAWLRPQVRTVEWPPAADAYPDLWAAAVELAGIAVDNPTGMTSSTTGGTTDSWGTQRRAEILADIGNRYSGSGSPAASFPVAQPWPDPAAR